MIDDIRIYNRSLSGDEIFELYYENQSIPGISQVIVQAELTSGSVLSVTAFLEGPFNGTEMNTTLNSNGYLPLSQPFNTTPWNYDGTESVATIPNGNIVDWVYVEIRSALWPDSATSETTFGRQAAFLLNSGKIVSTDGVSNLAFDTTYT